MRNNNGTHSIFCADASVVLVFGVCCRHCVHQDVQTRGRCEKHVHAIFIHFFLCVCMCVCLSKNLHEAIVMQETSHTSTCWAAAVYFLKRRQTALDVGACIEEEGHTCMVWTRAGGGRFQGSELFIMRGIDKSNNECLYIMCARWV